MSRVDVRHLLEDALGLQPGSVGQDDVLADLEGWDSLGIMSLIASVEEHYGSTMDPKVINACHTVRDLSAALPSSPAL